MPNESKIVLTNKINGANTEIINPNSDVPKVITLPNISGMLPIKKDSIVIEVGPNERFRTINSAIAYVDSHIPKVYENGLNTSRTNFRIILKDNFVIDEQVHYYGRDLGHISIESETANRLVPANVNCLTRSGSGVGQWSSGSLRPYFFFKYCRAPVIGFKFRPDITWRKSGIEIAGTDLTFNNTFGIMYDNVSVGLMLPNSGVENVHWGVFCANACVLSITNTFYKDVTYGICADNGSMVTAQYSNHTNVSSVAIWAPENSSIDATGSVFNNCYIGVRCSHGGRINCVDSTYSNGPNPSYFADISTGTLFSERINYNNRNNRGSVIYDHRIYPEGSNHRQMRMVYYTVR